MVGTDLLYMPTSYGPTDRKYDPCLDNFALETRFDPQGASNENSPTHCLNELGNKNFSSHSNSLDSGDKTDERLAQYTAAVRALYETSSDESEINVPNPSQVSVVKPKFWLGGASPEPAVHYACTSINGGDGRKRRKKTAKNPNNTLGQSSSSGCSSDEKRSSKRSNAAPIAKESYEALPISRCAGIWDLKRLNKSLPPLANPITHYKANRSGQHHKLAGHKRSSSLSQNENLITAAAGGQISSEPKNDINFVKRCYVKSRSLSLSTHPAPTLLSMNIVSAHLENDKTVDTIVNPLFGFSSNSWTTEKSKVTPTLVNNVNGPRVVVVTQEAELYRSPWLTPPHDFTKLKYPYAKEAESGKIMIKTPESPHSRRPDESKDFDFEPIAMNNNSIKLFNPSHMVSPVSNSKIHDGKRYSNKFCEPGHFLDSLPVIKTPVKPVFSSLRVGGSSCKTTNARASILHARTLPTTTTCSPSFHSRCQDFKENKIQHKSAIEMATPTLDLKDIFDNLDTVLQDTLDSIASTRAAGGGGAKDKKFIEIKAKSQAPTVRSHSISIFDEVYQDISSKPINHFNNYSRHNYETFSGQDVQIVDENLKRIDLTPPQLAQNILKNQSSNTFASPLPRKLSSSNHLKTDFNCNRKFWKPEKIDTPIPTNKGPPSNDSSKGLKDSTTKLQKLSLDRSSNKVVKLGQDKPIVGPPLCCEPKIATTKSVTTDSVTATSNPPRHHYTFSTVCTTSESVVNPSINQQSFSAPWRRADKRPVWYSQYISSTLMGGNRKAKKPLDVFSNFDTIFSTLPTPKPTSLVQENFEKVHCENRGQQHDDSAIGCPLNHDEKLQENNLSVNLHFDEPIPIQKKRSHFSLSLSMTERDWPPPPPNSFPATLPAFSQAEESSYTSSPTKNLLKDR